MTTVPPIIANVPAPIEISAISRLISRRKWTAACGTPPRALTSHSMWSPIRPKTSVGLLRLRVNRGYVERRIVMVPMALPRRHPDTDGGHDNVDHEQRHERVHHGLVDCVAHRLGSATGDGQAAVARHQAGDQT